MAATPPDGPLTALEAFVDALLTRDGAGGSWLPALLRAAPHGDRLGELVEAPGWLQTLLAVRGPAGRRGCFQYLTGPPREFEAWVIEHPDALSWPEGAVMSADVERLRRALVCDDPPGSRRRAQERARDLRRTRSVLSREWWRFEPAGRLECVLITERMVITVIGGGERAWAPASEWLPARPQLVRNLEAARKLADGKRWASLVLSDAAPDAAEDDERLARLLPEAAPHLDGPARAQLCEGYLGTVRFADAAAAVGLDQAASRWGAAQPD